MKALLGLVPAWGWAALGALLLALLGVWYAKQVDDARDEGRADVRAQWDAADLARERLANGDRIRRAEQSIAASAAHEAARASIARNLTEARHALNQALSAPISCPAGPSATLGDLRLPAGVLDGVRRAAEDDGGQRPDRPAPAEPGDAVRPRPADPGG